MNEQKESTQKKEKKAKSRGFKSGLIVLIAIVVIVLVLLGFIFFGEGFTFKGVSVTPLSTTSTSSSLANERNSNSRAKDYIAEVYFEGTIEAANQSYNQNWLMDTINTLKKDDNNVAMVLYINSPGGAVYQADQVYLELQEYKRAGKKLYAYLGPTAASGGYYVACAANKIYANRNSLTGSIGVIAGQFIDATDLLDKIGIKTATVHSGSNKLMGHYTEEFTQEQLDIMQSVCDECYTQFVSIVVSGRRLAYQDVLELADGRVYTAQQALHNGLIDAVDSYENMFDDLEDELTEWDIYETKVKTYRYEYKPTFMQSLVGSVEQLQNTAAAVKLGVPSKLLEEINGFDSYPAYLYQK